MNQGGFWELLSIRLVRLLGLLEELVDKAISYFTSDGRLLFLQSFNQLPDKVTCLCLHFQNIVVCSQAHIRYISVEGLEKHWEYTIR